ncbi:MAG: hypothetical protein GC185_04230 [Alphaproteobacteria bacterium]|nr:hypothetical protein [Alphaproteobacteria bacterium]
MPTANENSPAKEKPRLFPWLAAIAVIGGCFAVATLIHAQINHGHMAWWPYPAFMLMVAVIFFIEAALRREKE